MKERPILYNSEMVKAILALIKTETRRLRGLNKINENPDGWEFVGFSKDKSFVIFVDKIFGKALEIKVPYGTVGDQLWVREAFIDGYLPNEFTGKPDWENEEAFHIWYKATSTLTRWHKCDDVILDKVPWKSPYFLKKAYSRIQLEITEIMVERVQDITEEGAIAEGCKDTMMLTKQRKAVGYLPSENFQILWNSINEKRKYIDGDMGNFLLALIHILGIQILGFGL